MPLSKLFKLAGVAMLPFFVTGCVQVTLAWANLNASGGPAATPAILAASASGIAGGAQPSPATSKPALAAITTTQRWEDERVPILRDQLQAHIYGYLPDASDIRVIDRKVLDTNAFGGRATLEEITVAPIAQFGEVRREGDPFIIELVVPNNASGPVPIILKQSFSRRWQAVPHPDVTGRPEGNPRAISGIFTYVFGRYIATPPIADILDRGYALAVVTPGEFVPDNGVAGLAALRELSAGYQDDQTRWGAILAWGWGFSRTIDVLIDDPRIRSDGFIAYGHSRYGKSALVAAAFDERVNAVISHQSGTGGASLNRRKKGESVKEITESYPHWFSNVYAGYADKTDEMPVDQHHLLALVAPRPVFLGNARRDVWSDPNGALRAAIGADPVWKLYDQDGGLRQDRLDGFDPEADVALWIRPGTHGVNKEDWPAFLAFLDAHF